MWYFIPTTNETANVTQFLNISGRIINVKSQKQHAIQRNFVIATNIIEKRIIEKLTNSYWCNSQNCTRWRVCLEKPLGPFSFRCFQIRIEWTYMIKLQTFFWHLEVTLWPLNASMIQSKIELPMHQKYISWKGI